MKDGSTRILAVDDEENLLEILERILRRAGYDCVKAQDAYQAADVLERENIDLVLLDIRMPGKSGLELLSEIKSRYPYILVVMLTAIGDSRIAKRALLDGAYDYVTKPVARDKLLQIISLALHMRDLEPPPVSGERLQRRIYIESLKEPDMGEVEPPIGSG